MRTCPYNSNGISYCFTVTLVFAYGGRENDLCLFDLEKQESIFTARNVPHDFLSLRVPVWVSDMQVDALLILDPSSSPVLRQRSNWLL